MGVEPEGRRGMGEKGEEGEDGIVLAAVWVGRLKGCLIPPGFAVGLGSVSCLFSASQPQVVFHESKSGVTK